MGLLTDAKRYRIGGEVEKLSASCNTNIISVKQKVELMKALKAELSASGDKTEVQAIIAEVEKKLSSNA